MDRMKLMAGVIALLTVFGVAGCNRSPGTNTSDQTMGRSGGAGGGSATSPQSGGSSANVPSDNTGGSSGAPSGGAGR